MTPIVEVHTLAEAEKALNFDKAIIGINNRNLSRFKNQYQNNGWNYTKPLSSHSFPISL